MGIKTLQRQRQRGIAKQMKKFTRIVPLRAGRKTPDR